MRATNGISRGAHCTLDTGRLKSSGESRLEIPFVFVCFVELVMDYILSNYCASTLDDYFTACCLVGGYKFLIGARDSFGRTLMHYACASGNPLLVDQVIQDGADPYAVDDNGNHCTAYIDTSKEKTTQALFVRLAQFKGLLTKEITSLMKGMRRFYVDDSDLPSNRIPDRFAAAAALAYLSNHESWQDLAFAKKRRFFTRYIK